MKFTRKITFSALLLGATLLITPNAEASHPNGIFSAEEFDEMVRASDALEALNPVDIQEFEIVLDENMVEQLNHLALDVFGFPAPAIVDFTQLHQRIDAYSGNMDAVLDAPVTNQIDAGLTGAGGVALAGQPVPTKFVDFLNLFNALLLTGGLGDTPATRIGSGAGVVFDPVAVLAAVNEDPSQPGFTGFTTLRRMFVWLNAQIRP